MNKQNNNRIESYLRRTITRRQAIKAGGLAALGLAFSKPIIDTIRPTPIFANYGKPSIEYDDPDATPGTPVAIDADGGNDLVFHVVAASYHTVTGKLCNVSDHIPVTINEMDLDPSIRVGDEHLFQPNDITAIVLPDPSTFLPLNFSFPLDRDLSCENFDVTFNMSSDWTDLPIDGGASFGTEAKVKIVATVPSTLAETLLTITLVKKESV